MVGAKRIKYKKCYQCPFFIIHNSFPMCKPIKEKYGWEHVDPLKGIKNNNCRVMISIIEKEPRK